MNLAEQNDKAILDQVNYINQIPAVVHILEVVCQTTGMGFAAVARVTEEKWVACAVNDKIQFGLKPGGELDLRTTICNEIRQHQQPVIIDHVADDPHFSNHHTPLLYGFQSYISIPIKLKDGSFFGTLCAIDPKPAILNTPKIIGMFNLFAELIAFHLAAVQKIDETETSLREARQISELRDQFIAILGHDLRNPVGAVLNAAQVLLRLPLEDRAQRLATIVQDSSYRMKGLIDNILDFARGRLGDGIVLAIIPTEKLNDHLDQVVTELKLIWPDRQIDTHYEFHEVVNCDPTRLAQLFSNLLGNAISHGAKDKPILVSAISRNGKFELKVSNSGPKIPDSTLQHLFQPFSRGEVKQGQQGLGLGLYISSEIAKAHQGLLTVSSTNELTSFTLELSN